jgi:hypothetical protein
MPLQQIGKEYTCETRDYNIRVRLSEMKWMFYFRVYQMNKWDEYPYENWVYASKEYKDINKCEKEMIDFISENYNVI